MRCRTVRSRRQRLYVQPAQGRNSRVCRGCSGAQGSDSVACSSMVRRFGVRPSPIWASMPLEPSRCPPIRCAPRPSSATTSKMVGCHRSDRVGRDLQAGRAAAAAAGIDFVRVTTGADVRRRFDLDRATSRACLYTSGTTRSAQRGAELTVNNLNGLLESPTSSVAEPGGPRRDLAAAAVPRLWPDLGAAQH